MLLAIISINTKSKIDKCLLFFIQFRVFLPPFFTPVELLGLAFYSLIKKLNSYSELKQGIVDSLEIQVNPNDVINYIKKLEDNSFEFDVLNFETKYQNAFYMNGNLVDVNFDDKTMREFLLENSEELNILADEFIRKIYQFKTGINN